LRVSQWRCCQYGAADRGNRNREDWALGQNWGSHGDQFKGREGTGMAISDVLFALSAAVDAAPGHPSSQG
jgi:hypothetical protein